MSKMMRLAGATLVATGEVAMIGIVASGAAVYSVVKGFQAAKKRVTDAWTENEPEDTATREASESTQEKITDEPVGEEESENPEGIQEEEAESEGTANE